MKDELDRILDYMGVDPSSKIGYGHLHRFLFLCRKETGKEWLHIRNLLRISLNTQFRYIDEMKQGFVSWGVIDIKDDGKLLYIGLKANKGLGRPFQDYSPPEKNPRSLGP